MRISNFRDAEDNVPKHIDFTWAEFATQLGPHEYRPGGSTAEESQRLKELCPCFSPAEYPDGARRGKKNVLQVWMLVLDVDHVDESTLHWFLGRLQEMHLAAVVYSSWSHARDPWRFRVVIPLDRPVPGPEWPGFWARAITLFNSVCDPRCKDASRIYFGPFAPIGSEHLNFYHVYQGAELPVAYVMSLPLPAGTEPEGEADDRIEAVAALLGPVWPSGAPGPSRHGAHMAFAGGLLRDGVSDELAVDVMEAVAEVQEPGNGDREKRKSIVEHTREQLDANEKVTGWTTLAPMLGPNGAAILREVRELLKPTRRLNREALERFAGTLVRRSKDEDRELGHALKKVCAGSPFDEALTEDMCRLLAVRFAEADPDSIGDIFFASLQVMTSPRRPSKEEIAEMVRSRQKEVAAKRKKHRGAQAARISEAFGTKRTHPYSPDELLSFGDMTHRWIVQFVGSYYLFFNGEYKGPFTKENTHAAAATYLAAARTAGVQLHKMTKEGEIVFRSLLELVNEYGCVAERVVADLSAQKAVYNAAEKTLVEAPCPRRDITPRYHEAVHQWLVLLGGEKVTKLLIWVGTVTWLHHIARILLLTDVDSTGKGLLANGLARLWKSKVPASLDSAFANFNDGLLSSPLCFGDETLPKDFRGNVKSGELREHAQARTRKLRRKFLPEADLLGATRTIIAANNVNILRIWEHLTSHDISALALRFLHIRASKEAQEYLARTDTTGWVDGDMIAEHALWLEQSLLASAWKPEHRFLIADDNEDLVRALKTSSTVTSLVCLWLTSYIQDPALFDGNANTRGWVRIYQGELLVNIWGLLKFWDIYVGSQRAPAIAQMSAALVELSHPDRVKLENPRLVEGRLLDVNKRPRTVYYRVVKDVLLKWAAEQGFGDVDELRKLIERGDTPANFVPRFPSHTSQAPGSHLSISVHGVAAELASSVRRDPR